MSNLNDYKKILFLFYIKLKCRCPDWTGTGFSLVPSPSSGDLLKTNKSLIQPIQVICDSSVYYYHIRTISLREDN